MTREILDRVTALTVFVTTVAAFVFLVYTGKDTAGLVALCGPVIAGLWAVREVRRESAEQNAKLDVIHENTNGVLTARIESAVGRALDQHAEGAGG